MPIPRILHQTAARVSPLHPRLRDTVARLKALNPGWEHRLYDDEEARACIARVRGARDLALFDRLHPDYGAAKADLFRYARMYEAGGVYLDIKSGTARPLDEIIRPDDTYLLSFWNDGPGSPHADWGKWPQYGVAREFQQWHIVCAPRHPFLEAALERAFANLARYHPVRDGVGQAATVAMTGPVAYTRAITPLLSAHPHRVVDAAGEGLVYSTLADTVRDAERPGSSAYKDSRQSLLTGFGPPPLIAARRVLSHLVGRGGRSGPGAP